MKRKWIVLLVGALLLAAGSGFAQQTPGNIAALEVQKVKSGMVSQYEAGRKQKAAWHKQQNDSQPLFVWEVLSGEATGSYIVGRLGQHWADMDKPSIPDEADKAEFQKVVGTAVESVVTHYYEFLPKISRPESGNMPTKLAEVLTFHTRPGREAEFRAAAARVNEAAQKTNWPLHYYWYSLASGGPTGAYVLVLPHANWADFEDRPEVKPYREVLKDAFGQTEADSIVRELDDSVQKATSEIVQFRPDLSYLPGR